MWLKSWVLLLFLTVWTKPRLTKLTVGRWHPTNSKYEPLAGWARCFIAENLQVSTSLVSCVSWTVPPERTCRQPVMRRCTLGNLLHSTTQMKELRHKVCAWQARGWFDPDNNEDLYCLTPLWNMHKNVPCGPFVIRGTTGLQRKIRATCGFLSCRTGLSNIKAWGPELARWKLQSGPLDKFGKYEGRDKFGAFNYILQLFLLHHGHSFHTN